MQSLKRLLIYLLLVAVLALGVYAALRPLAADCWTTLLTGRGTAEYQLLACDGQETVWAAGTRNGSLIVTHGSTAGRLGGTLRLGRLEGFPQSCALTALWAPSSGGVLLGLENLDAETPRTEVYYITDNTLTQLLSVEGDGNTVHLTQFSEYDGVVHFGAAVGSAFETYAYTPGGSGLERLAAFSWQQDFTAALVLDDGSAALANAAGQVAFSSGQSPWNTGGGAALALWQGRLGLYFLDGQDGEIRLLTASGAQDLPAVDASQRPASLRAWAVSQTGTVVELCPDGSLYLQRDGSIQSITGGLYRSRAVCGLILAGLLLAVCFAAYALWYWLCVHHREQLTMLVRYGVLTALALALLASGAMLVLVQPYARAQSRDRAQSAMTLAAALSADPANLDALTDGLLRSDAGVTDARAALYRLDESGETAVFRLTAGGGGPAGACTRALGADEALETALTAALEPSNSFLTGQTWGQTWYTLLTALPDGQILALSARYGGLEAQAAQFCRSLAWMLIALCCAVELVLLLVLGRILTGIGRVTRGMDALDQQNLHVEVFHDSGDEVEGLAESFNAMSQKLARAAEDRSAHDSAYLRFVPRELVALLGAESIEEVGKQSVASRRMATVSIGYYFDQRVYESRTRELFDSINEVIACTADLVTKNGGIVCNYTEDGYTALFDCDSDIAVSTAVAIRQEILALNRTRDPDNQVRLCIAIDVADVMAGVLGNEHRMEIDALSAGFNTTRQLLTLFSRFEANILCTEAVMGRAKNYASRYIGKTRDGDELIRVYEIYDGDAYAERTGKAAMAQQFAEGVYLFYARDFTAAKRSFMDITRQHSRDGAARYYLYLADRYEKQAPEVLSLDD